MSLLKDHYEARLVNRDRKVMILDPRKAAVVATREAVEAKFRGNPGGVESSGRMTSGTENTVEETGTCLGITDSGALIVKLDTGEKREVKAGEVSVRGIYGYV
jgi:BirA family biotin operon repressor/biotin-[acetyl-CoA-carboxylase] ligase